MARVTYLDIRSAKDTVAFHLRNASDGVLFTMLGELAVMMEAAREDQRGGKDRLDRELAESYHETLRILYDVVGVAIQLAPKPPE